MKGADEHALFLVSAPRHPGREGWGRVAGTYC